MCICQQFSNNHAVPDSLYCIRWVSAEVFDSPLAKFFWTATRDRMGRTLLFLVDRQGGALDPAFLSAVEAAYRWASHDYPNLDSSLLATWAEQVGRSMAERKEAIESPRRYAFAAMGNRIREHFRSGGFREVTLGIAEELEDQTAADLQSAAQIERQVLFIELRAQLSQRDREILILLQQDVTSPASIASALGISYNAAAKAVQRVKERLHAILTRKPLPLTGKEPDED